MNAHTKKTSKKRILIINYEFPPVGGGGGVAAEALAKGFQENDYAVDYLTSQFNDAPKKERREQLTIHRVRVLGRTNEKTASLLSLLSFPVCALWRGIQLCRTHNYAFINTHFVVPSGPLGWILSKLFRLPNLLSIHGGDIYDPSKSSSPHNHALMRATVRFLLNRATRVVAQSSNTQENAITYYRPKRSPVIIPLAYEPTPFSPRTRSELGLKEEATYLIGIGRLVKRKSFETLIELLATLDTSFEAIIVGEGPERKPLEKLATQRGVHERLHLVGAVSNEEKFQYLHASDIFVLTSLHEGFGIVLQEAMQCNLPIIATNHGGQIDLIEHDKNGLLVPPQDVETFKRAVERIQENPVRFSTHEASLHAFSPAAIANDYAKLLQESSDASEQAE